MKLQQALATVAMSVAVWLGAGLPAQAQDPAKDYPSKNITLVVPFPPGGGNDAMGRIMADRLSAGLGKTVVVENRGAGAGIVGTRSVIKARARRLHADARAYRQHRHQPDALRQRRLRSTQGLHAARPGRSAVARAAGASVGAGQGRRPA